MVGRPQKKKEYSRTWVTLIIELLFIAVPFVVILIVLILSGESSRFWQISEWAFAGVVLAGQGLTKFLSGKLAQKSRGRGSATHWVVLITLIGALLTFFAGVILYKIVESKEAVKSASAHLSSGLVDWQLTFFIIGVFIFIILGGAGELAKIREENGQQGDSPQVVEK
jgi:TRAP-type mannitol/chloroaromatic compound transport system permease small subunit